MHSIVFENAQSDWNEALPLGNGSFGGMAYFRKNQYWIAFNHYEVYYTMYHRYSHQYQTEQTPVSPGRYRNEYEKLMETARQNTGDYTKEEYLHYRRTIWPTADIPRQAGLHNGESHPPTGEMAVILSEKLQNSADYSLRLDLEAATVRLNVRKDTANLSAETIVFADSDSILTNIRQTESGLTSELLLHYPQRRNHEGFTIQWKQKDPQTFLCQVSFYPQGENREQYPPFSFAVIHRLIGASGTAMINGEDCRVQITETQLEWSILSYVVTELSEKGELESAAEETVRQIEAEIPEHRNYHRQYWKNFFYQSAVYLPDKVVERLWYLNLYVLGCCSGRKGKRYEQASGLNGLWDIRQPTMWGSLWYWDVNIEATFWPVYAANHLELAEAFCDGFLSYADQASRRAQEFYGMRGYAMDYPHPFYNCMWPWCAQYLWWYYEYTGDLDFLREKAYPVFKNLALFIEDVMQYDPESNKWSFFPDISPEQGPITQNSTITIACVKYLLKAAREACSLLKLPSEEMAWYEKLLNRLPPYSTVVLDRYGEVLKDSELAPAGIRLRHPSLLMPIFPLSELGPESSEQEFQIAKNTVFFASENTEIGVFPFGWISAAAARLGMGNTALRVLYEQGLDCIIRANGMGSEETDRWLNHCVVNSSYFYQPFMMECVGEVVNCVNEMLLQSYDGVIRLFPAVPNGDPENYRKPGRQKAITEPWGENPAPDWKDCGFDRLLAKGGFEVSARMKDGKICWIQVKSLHGGKARIRIPTELGGYPVVSSSGAAISVQIENQILELNTETGILYTIGQKPEEQPDAGPDTLCYTTHLERKNFIGKTRNTDTWKLLDAFLADYYVANDRCHPLIAYRFNFGVPLEQMSVNCLLESKPSCDLHLKFLKITPNQTWCTNLGFGFGPGEIHAVDSAQGEYLLRDGLEGKTKTSFFVELPKGRYDILVVSGSQEASHSTICSLDTNRCEMNTLLGEYQARIIPVVHTEDGILELSMDTTPENSWNLTLIVIRKILALI